MLKFLRKIVSSSDDPRDANKRKIYIAAASLYIEIAKADTEYSNDEKDNISSILKACFDLKDAEIEDILEESAKEVNKSVSLFEFSSIINQYFTYDEKYQLLRNLWKIVFTDRTVDIYEEHILKQIAGTLNLDRQDIISTKMEIKKELGI